MTKSWHFIFNLLSDNYAFLGNLEKPDAFCSMCTVFFRMTEVSAKCANSLFTVQGNTLLGRHIPVMAKSDVQFKKMDLFYMF